jgi:hypothetical protein
MAPDATALVEEIRRFTAERWSGEPLDVQRLRSFSLPPMGNLPCVLYCNFDLFWTGEQLQVCRQAALAGELPPRDSAHVAALLLDRVAARAAKWEMAETVALVRRAADVLRAWQPASPQELAAVLEELLVAVDRVQAAVDAIIPWSDLDRSLRLRAPT